MMFRLNTVTLSAILCFTFFIAFTAVLEIVVFIVLLLYAYTLGQQEAYSD